MDEKDNSNETGSDGKVTANCAMYAFISYYVDISKCHASFIQWIILFSDVKLTHSVWGEDKILGCLVLQHEMCYDWWK